MISKSIKEATLTDGTKIKLSLEVQSEVDYSTLPAELKTVVNKIQSVAKEVTYDVFKECLDEMGMNLLCKVFEDKLSNVAKNSGHL